ncbi:MAG: cytochrome b/b6 domain-containing protein [Acidimicrobiales bacterium]
MPIPTATERAEAPVEPAVVRNNRPTRWLHAALYLTTTALLITGWWLRTGHEGEPSVLAELFDSPDTDVHEIAGWVLLGIAVAGPLLGIRAAITFVRETLRVDRGDGAWFWRWPLGAVTGRFGRHRGHFDPGQRIANMAFVATLGTLVVTGVMLTTLSGGSTFATMVRVHRAATYVLTALVAGHLVITLGLLPGYRGVWRAMHLRGRVPDATARRVWPASISSEPGSDANHQLRGRPRR